MMRITNNMMISNMMRYVNSNLNRMSDLDRQMATGKRIAMPSDDPVGISKVLKLSSDISTYEQYKENVNESLSWIEQEETAITQLKDAMQRVRELTVRGATGSLTVEDRQSMKAEISQLKDQIVSIGNSTYGDKYIFAGYNTMEKPFTIEKTEVGEKIKYNGKFLSPGGIVDKTTVDDDFKDFLTNKNNKELTHDQMRDKMEMQIGTGDFTNVNITGNELFQKGFGGTFETLTKLEKVLNGEEEYKHGFVDMIYDTGDIAGADLDNSSGDKTITIKIGEKDSFDLKLPNKVLSQEEIQKAIDEVDHLKKNGVKVSVEGTNISFSAQSEIVVNATLGTIINDANGTSKQHIAPISIGERLEGTLNTDTDFEFEINGEKITLPTNKKYELDTKMGRYSLIKDIQAEIDNNTNLKGKVNVSFTNDNRLQFTGNYEDATAAAGNTFDDITVAYSGTSKLLTKLGFSDGQKSEKAIVKSEKLDTSAMLKDIDENMHGILATLSEIGAKTNRLELEEKRIDDSIINFNKLLSKTRDVDMAETIMNFKMQENVYRASLSVGAKIIQPSLLDFLR